MSNYLTPYVIWSAAALNAFIAKGHDMETAARLADKAAVYMILESEKESEIEE